MKKLYRFNEITGCWVYVRTCQNDNAQEWLKIFQADEPHAKFKFKG